MVLFAKEGQRDRKLEVIFAKKEQRVGLFSLGRDRGGII